MLVGNVVNVISGDVAPGALDHWQAWADIAANWVRDALVLLHQEY